MDSEGKKQAMNWGANLQPYFSDYANANCVGFGTGSDEIVIPGGLEFRNPYSYIDEYGFPDARWVSSDYYDILTQIEGLQITMGGKDNAIVVSGIDAEIPDGWYMIAIRSGYSIATAEDQLNAPELFRAGYCTFGISGDVHVMVLHNVYGWIEKQGSRPVQHIYGTSPESPDAWPGITQFDEVSDVKYMIIRGGI